MASTRGTVTSVFIYPVAGEPGQALDRADIGVAGLDGDRPKSAPVSLVTVAEYVETHPRANLVVDLSSEDLDSLVGERIHIGEVALDVVERKVGCGVVYGHVVQGGAVRPGDVVCLEMGADG